jgi:threonine synthase
MSTENFMFVLHCPVCQQDFLLEYGLLGCPHQQNGEEHILTKKLTARADLVQMKRRILNSWQQKERQTFKLFQPLMASACLGNEVDFRSTLRRLDRQLLRWEKNTFQVTPMQVNESLSRALNWQGGLWIKDETGNIAGSHKGRHLMGTLLYLEALRHLNQNGNKHVLAIYSCGNAALGASAVARAGEYELHTFVPEDIEPRIADKIQARGAVVEKIARSGGGRGDPCYLAFKDAVDHRGWLPFSCAGNDNWSHIEGGQSMGWETVLQLRDAGVKASAVVLQVGGGAMGRAIVEAWEDMRQLDLVEALPRFYACQPEGGFPFVRAYFLVLRKIAEVNGFKFDLQYRADKPLQAIKELKRFTTVALSQIRDVTEFVYSNFDTWAVEGPLMYVRYHRREFMWPWDGAIPHSLAHGILDDEAYDWYYLLLGLLKTGGRALILPEESIGEAHAAAQSVTGIKVCPTGSAGLAGMMNLLKSGEIHHDENVVLFFTGKDRLRINDTQ